MSPTTSSHREPAARRAGEPAPLRQLGQWELLRVVGEGTLAQVFQARPIGVRREAAYAVKVLRAKWQADPRVAALFCREAIVAREVAHPHLIALLAAHVAEPPYYVVGPLLRGCTLAEQIRISRPAAPVALWIARQVAEALAALHAAGWLHCDVKPGNIFVSPDGHATLLDLGFARRLDESTLADERPLLGTISYMAPELLTPVYPADQRSDFYSLGATLFEMLSGRAPVAARDLAELELAHRHGRREQLHLLAPHLPPRLTRLVESLLAHDPLRRPADARELIGQLVSLEIETLGDRIPA